MTERTCLECGTTFTTKRRHATCSLPCRQRRNRRRVESSFTQRERLEIFSRDDWLCALCKEPVDPLLEWPHPMSAAVDHVTPVSQGGEHSIMNAQCSHWVCNSRKGPAGLTSHVS